MTTIEWNADSAGQAAAELKKAAQIYGAFPTISSAGFAEYSSFVDKLLERARAYHDGIVAHLEYGDKNVRGATRDFQACDVQVQDSLNKIGK